MKAQLLEQKPAQGYYDNARWEYLEVLSEVRPTRVLELGCGAGATGAQALQQGLCAEYIGIEVFKKAAEEARQVLTRVHVGDVDAIDLPYKPNTFDVFIASEVLEHLRAPEQTLQRLLPLVRPGGVILASSPNIAWYGNLLNLLRGKFEYTESGMMDTTHLRWFTPDSFASMFRKLGIEVDSLGPNGQLRGVKRWMDLLTGHRLQHLFWYQINLRGHKQRPLSITSRP